MAEKNASTVLVLIFGPPASGKTTLAANLKGRLSQCLLLSFDDIFSAEEQKVAIQTRGSLKILRRYDVCRVSKDRCFSQNMYNYFTLYILPVALHCP